MPHVDFIAGAVRVMLGTCACLYCIVSSLLLAPLLSLAATEIDLTPIIQDDRRASPGGEQELQGSWLQLAPGLEFGEFHTRQGQAPIAALRIDPANFDFILCNESQEGGGPKTLKEWTEKKSLAAAINASMYLPDNRTSTGYMRSGNHVNNGRIMDRFGAFFVAGPRKPDLPQARIIDRDEPDWRKELENYDTVIQNYRMTNTQRRILWASGGPLYSISAIAQDGEGKILFLHSRKPVEAYTFVQDVLHLPLDVRTIMYVEGGGQAGMLIDYGGLKRDMSGLHAPSLLITGNLRAALPNVLGIKPKPSRSSIVEEH